jgi:signal transduction histidine kinase
MAIKSNWSPAEHKALRKVARKFSEQDRPAPGPAAVPQAALLNSALELTLRPSDGWPILIGYLCGITESKQARDERRREEIQLAGEKRLLEMVASGCALAEVLAALCRFVEAISVEYRCGVYLLDGAGPRLRCAASPSLAATVNDPMFGVPVGGETAAFATAACLKTPVIAGDVESDPLGQASPFASLALAHGLRACWSTPICSVSGQVFGTLVILQRNPASPTARQQDLIAQVTHIASLAIERAQREAALKRSEAFLAEAQRLSSAGSFSWIVSTGEITWSEQLYRIFQFDQRTPLTLEVIGSRVHPEDIPLFNDMIARGRDTASDLAFEQRLLLPDHSVKYLHVVAHATRDLDGQLEYIGAVQDVTQHRLSEEALGKARSELARVARIMSLGALTASIAHEVNQPLSGIVTNASTCLRMLAAEPADVDGARETARRTLRDAHRAADVIKRLRALFAKKTATTEAVDLNEATREVIALSFGDLQRRRVVLRSELAENLAPITGDRVQLQQVILNLLLNAADAMGGVEDRPRQLLIKTQADEFDRVRLSVRDTGVGFAAQGAELFEPFHSTKSEGMGIGLFVSRFIIESHCGRLWATSNEGPGATFSFSIPCGPMHGALGVTGGRSFGAMRMPALMHAADRHMGSL